MNCCWRVGWLPSLLLSAKSLSFISLNKWNWWKDWREEREKREEQTNKASSPTTKQFHQTRHDFGPAFDWICVVGWAGCAPRFMLHSQIAQFFHNLFILHTLGAPLPVNKQSKPSRPLGRARWDCFCCVEWAGAVHIHLPINSQIFHICKFIC